MILDELRVDGDEFAARTGWTIEPRRAGGHAAAIPHWHEAHRLYPDNWTYKRQAWNFEDPLRQGHTDAYDSSWFEDLKQIGAENYYPPIVP